MTFAGLRSTGVSNLDASNTRYYDTNTGRFLSQDAPGADPGAPNSYGYSADNPTTYVDPAGTEAHYFHTNACPGSPRETSISPGKNYFQQTCQGSHHIGEWYVSAPKAGDIGPAGERRLAWFFKFRLPWLNRSHATFSAVQLEGFARVNGNPVQPPRSAKLADYTSYGVMTYDDSTYGQQISVGPNGWNTVGPKAFWASIPRRFIRNNDLIHVKWNARYIPNVEAAFAAITDCGDCNTEDMMDIHSDDFSKANIDIYYLDFKVRWEKGGG